MRFLAAVFAALLVSAPMASFAEENPVPAPARIGHVNDLANMLDQKEAARLEKRLTDLHAKLGVDICGITVGDVSGDAGTYLENLVNSWNVPKESGYGYIALLAIKTDPRGLRIRTGLMVAGVELGRNLMPDHTRFKALIPDIMNVRGLYEQGRTGEAFAATLNVLILMLEHPDGPGLFLYQRKGFLNDFAEVFSAEDAAGVEALLADYARRTGRTFMVITVRSTNGASEDGFLGALLYRWGIPERKRGTITFFEDSGNMGIRLDDDEDVEILNHQGDVLASFSREIPELMASGGIPLTLKAYVLRAMLALEEPTPAPSPAPEGETPKE